MRIEELQSSLEAQELRMTERNYEQELEQTPKAQTLKASSSKKNQICNKFGHFAADCWPNKVSKGGETNIDIEDSDDEPVLLMASANVGGSMVEWWYMDIGFSNHLTRNKQWLVDFDYGKRTKIICANGEYLNAKGMSNVRIKLSNSQTVLINDVWYVPGMNSNLMSVGHLIEKGFSVTIKDNLLELYDNNQKLIMQYELGRSSTFKVNVATTDTQ
ncbi:uncharacterized protein LOC127080280 [Lathyrus oleraceus]|uniref:uncharacterized protein LOC127080280 n=1 Tax=Pisum sativum TaxID=3888 RepID=UPI0021D1CC02|nr:uncharacterized protein LOC127080280 [Pisum sativum]